jgi:hypothetical protein
MTVQCGDNCISQRKVYKCIGRLKKRQMTVNNAHSAWPSSAVHAEVMEQIDQSIQEN